MVNLQFFPFITAPNEEEYPTWKKREKILLTVEDWLTYIGLGKYIALFIENGYDDLNFLGEDIISCKQDLVDIGITDEKDITHLLESLKKKGNSAGKLARLPINVKSNRNVNVIL